MPPDDDIQDGIFWAMKQNNDFVDLNTSAVMKPTASNIKQSGVMN